MILYVDFQARDTSYFYTDAGKLLGFSLYLAGSLEACRRCHLRIPTTLSEPFSPRGKQVLDDKFVLVFCSEIYSVI